MMKSKRALDVFKRGFDDSLTAGETKEYCKAVREGLYLRMWYEQKYGATRAAKIVKDMADEAKDVEEENNKK